MQMIDEPTAEVADETATEQSDGNISEDDLLNLIAEPTEVQPEEIEESEETETVLSQSNDDILDPAQEPVEEDDMPKSVKKLLKQVDRLTARAKSSEEANAKLLEKLDSINQEPKTESEGIDQEISKIHTIDDLNKLKKEALSAKKWAMQNLGKDYVTEGDKEYSDDEIREIFVRSDEYLTELIPEREKFLHAKQESGSRAKQSFAFLAQPESAEYKLYQQISESPQYKALEQLPNAEFVRGVIVKGVQKMQEEQGKQTSLRTAKAKPNPPVLPESDSLPPSKKSKTVDKSKVLGKGNITEDALTKFFQQS